MRFRATTTAFLLPLLILGSQEVVQEPLLNLLTPEMARLTQFIGPVTARPCAPTEYLNSSSKKCQAVKQGFGPGGEVTAISQTETGEVRGLTLRLVDEDGDCITVGPKILQNDAPAPSSTSKAQPKGYRPPSDYAAVNTSEQSRNEFLVKSYLQMYQDVQSVVTENNVRRIDGTFNRSCLPVDGANAVGVFSLEELLRFQNESKTDLEKIGVELKKLQEQTTSVPADDPSQQEMRQQISKLEEKRDWLRYLMPTVSGTSKPGSSASLRIVGKDLLASQCMACPSPAYPEPARKTLISGTVTVFVVVGKTGAVEEATILSGNAQLQQATLDAIAKWKYRPFSNEKGEPIQAGSTVAVPFLTR